MQQINLPQGSPEWLAHRAKHFNASDAPVMMGCHPTRKRNELLRELKTGIAAEVSSFVQERVFNPGHEVEALARPLAEEIIGEELYPVTGTLEVDGLPLSASFDGLTMAEDTGFEHKQHSFEIAQAIEQTGEPPIYHCWQMEHQLLVSGANRVIFVGSNGTKDKWADCWYESKPERRAALLAGWAQFQKDLAEYVVPPVAPVEPIGRAPETLPSLHITVRGEVSESNLAEFKDRALNAIKSVNRKLVSAQDLADSAKARKWCADIELRVAAAKQNALGQTASIDLMFRTLDEISAAARDVRLDLEKQEKARTQQFNLDVVNQGREKFAAFIRALEETMPGARMPNIDADFAGSIKGLSSMVSKQNAVDSELSRVKILANEVANRIQVNLRLVAEMPGMAFLFPDLAQIAVKANDDFAAVVSSRIAAHEKAEADRVARDRARIAEEERIKAEKKLRDEQEQADRVRLAAEVAATAIEDERQRVAKAQTESEAAAQQVIQQAAAPAPVVEQAQRSIVAPERFEQLQATASAFVEALQDEKPTLKLGEISARLGFNVTADFLAEVGFAAHVDRNARLYRESLFPAMCDALISHIHGVKASCRATA
jgi:putative phage-type endonuclease